MDRGRLFLGIAVLLVIIGLFAWYFSSNDPAVAPSSDEPSVVELQPTTLKILFPLEKPTAIDEVIKGVEEKLARDGLPFKLEFTYVPLDQYWNKVWVVAASGEPYDLTWTAFSNISDLVSKKTLAPLDNALKNYGQDIIKNTPDYAFKGVTVNGKIYGIPRVMPLAEFQNFVQIRADLRKKYGLPEIRTVADMDNYFATIKQNEPDIIPYFFDPGRFMLREYGDVALIAGEFLNAPVYIDPADPELKVRNTYESDFFYKIMIKMHEWQHKGYIPYSPSDTSQINDPEAVFNAGKIAATWSFVFKQTERIDTFKALTPNGELENVFLHPEKPRYMFTAADNILSVFSTSQHVNEAVAFVNWVRSSQENYDLFSYGIENVNYKLVGNSISYDGIAPEHHYMPINWSWNDIKYERFSKYISPEYEEVLRNWDKGAVLSPTLGFVPDLAPIKSEIAQVNVLIKEFLPELFDVNSDWDSTLKRFREKLQDGGIDNVIQEIQKQFDAFREKG